MSGRGCTQARFALGLFLALGLPAAAAGCRHERRDLQTSPDISGTSGGVVLDPLRAGGMPAATAAALTSYQENAYALNEGKRLFESYNCVGCHAHGGGAIGPALMDDRWIYGSAPENVFATIVEGRPNGMPSFRGRIPDFQVAELAAYVRSMSGLTTSTWAPGRDDHMHVKPSESTVKEQPPVRQKGADLQ
jgi:cytochrome c oxidase cbb3-type subunit 3